MDELRAFFNNPCPSNAQVKKLRGPATAGRQLTKEDTLNEMNKPEEHRHSVLASGTDYADAIKKREMETYLKNEGNRDTFQSVAGGLDSLEQLSSYSYSMQNIESLTEEAMNEVYKKYAFGKKREKNNLAINDYSSQILSSIASYPVVIVEGPTGCGKTTQVPQWILDDSFENRRPCKIVVTQPRRIAAISIAKRVAQERGWDVSGVVGYQVALEAKVTSDTRITYVTTGVLLQKLVSAKNMNEYTHVILDEVHERGQEMDFLLLVVKRLLYTVSPHVKVVLMSATINRKSFADYFMIPTPMGLQAPISIKVVKNDPMFIVKTFYLNHLNKFGSVLDKITSLKNETPGIPPEMHHLVIKLIDAFEQIDEREEVYVNKEEADLPSVLVFLPGINEIEQLYDCLTNSELRSKMSEKLGTTKSKWWVLPLHSTITADEQVRVFQRAPPGQRKIILATNIAESSITVPDIKYVIDYCLMKMLVSDSVTNFTSLQLMWASRSNCEQRAGRAGRVRDGRVYRLVTERFYDTFADACIPEIERCPLERLVLLAKTLDMGPPSGILALAMNPPDITNIQKTILILKEVGGMKKTINEEWCVSDGDITYLGRVMAKLPLDVRVSKLIMLGYIYGCFDESIIMAAAMSVKNVFNTPFREKLNAYNSKLTWADGSTSDCIAFLNVYKVWNHLRKVNYFKQGGSEAQWARRFYVQVRALRELDDLVRELRVRLAREGLETSALPSPWAKHEITLVLKVIIAGAFYPQYFVQTSGDECREREAVRALGGLNPRSSLYLTGWPLQQPLQPYAPLIRSHLRRLLGDDPRVTFDNGSKKIFLTFSDGSDETKSVEKTGDPTIPGQVVLPVYKAVKARQIRTDIRVPLLPIEKANELAAALENASANVELDKMVPRLPDIDDTHFPLKLSQFITVSKFWVHYDDESTTAELRQIEMELNRGALLAGAARAGALCAAPYVSANATAYYRARIIDTLPRDMLEVLYIDYGSHGRVSVCSVRELPAGACRSTPPLAMRCALAGVAPAPLLDHHAHWAPAAEHLFTTLITRGRLLGKVYSVVNGVVSIELFAEHGKTSVNKALLDKGLAVPSEESYESKLNHDVREMANGLNMSQKRAYNKEQAESAFFHMNETEPPNYKECYTDVCLNGPFSPLEISVHNLMYAGREKKVNIEWNSVNSVLLDTEPQEIYEKLLVAAQVGQNESGSTLTLHHTTLMPNVPGLPAVMALLFCPAAELRRDTRGTRYVSTLCGLGSEDDGTPYFPEHDILVNIDAEIDVEDIGLINHVRHLMDYMMYCSEGQDTPTADDEFHPKVPKFIRDDIMKLLRKRRKHREPYCVANAWRWRSAEESELLEISVPGMAERALVFSLHRPLELRATPRADLLRLHAANQVLHQMIARTSSSSNQTLTCELCNTGPLPAPAMRIHLYSNMHKEKEDDLRDVQP